MVPTAPEQVEISEMESPKRGHELMETFEPSDLPVEPVEEPMSRETDVESGELVDDPPIQRKYPLRIRKLKNYDDTPI